MVQREFFENDRLKALTLWQPYAQAVAAGLKRFETRSWATRHRGALAIHAAARPMKQADRELAARYGMEAAVLPFSAIVAVVELVECIEMTPEFIAAQSPQELAWGDWRVGRWAWRFGNVRVLSEPIPALGAQGLWTWRSE